MPSPDATGAPAADHYFAERPRSPSARRELRFLYRGVVLRFEIDRGVFATHGLDPGTALLIECLDLRPTDRVLDLGCGWGALGAAAARQCPEGHVVLTDVNRRAAGLARENLRRNRLERAEVRVGSLFEPVAGERFDAILTNPPYHAGRPAILALLAGAREHLRPGGRLFLVGKGSHGIRFYQEWLAARWPGGVTVRGRRSGYRVLEARPDAGAGDARSGSDGAPPDAGTEALKREGHLGGAAHGRPAPARRSRRPGTIPPRKRRGA